MTPSTEAERVPPEHAVSVTAAAEELGVHYMTAYRYIRTGRMTATKRAGKWWIDPADLAAVIAEGTGARRTKSASTSGRNFDLPSFIARLIAGDTAGCWVSITAALHGGASPPDIYAELIQPAMIEVGKGWRQGNVSVAEEHRATASALRLIGQLGPLFRHRGRRRGTIVLGAAAGDYHSVPSAILSDLLCNLHFDVIDLGGNTPTESFIDVALDVDDLIGIGIGVSLAEAIQGARDQASVIRAALPDVFLLLGGPPVAAEAQADLLAIVDAVSHSSADACAAFELASNA